MSRSIALLATLASQVAAHGYMKTVSLDGVDFEGFNRWNPNPDPEAIGWTFSTEDEGPELDISSANFVCRSDSTASSNYGTIAAGGTASFLWTSDDPVRNPDGWAHQGPIMTYIAPCPDNDCESADKTTLLWTKIQESGVVSGQANTGGIWATDVLRENGGVYDAVIPKTLAAGRYVVRSELIALHRAHLPEPEFYPQCANIEVTGDGSDDLSGKGVLAANIYSTSDKQLFGFSIHDSRDSEYPLPGPALYSADSSSGPVDDPVTEAPVEEEPVEENEEEVEEPVEESEEEIQEPVTPTEPEEENEEPVTPTEPVTQPRPTETRIACNFFG